VRYTNIATMTNQSDQSTVKALPDSVSVQYSELMQQCVRPAPDGSNISFKSKLIREKRYWYLYISLGKRRSEHYLGEDSPELQDKMAREKALWESTADDRGNRARLVAMLLAGGATPTPTNEGKVLALLERSGIFLSGGVVVGTLAFRAYANMLGVIWHSDLQTRDIDIASDNTFQLAVPAAEQPVSLSRTLLDSGMGFLEVPALNRKSVSTEFKIKGQELSVELLTTMKGKSDSKPILIESLGAYAEPIRFMDYLLADIQPATLLYKHGILINVPGPARFAFHKLVVSQRRPVSQREKIRRDLSQAEQLFGILLEGRPFDLVTAYEAALETGTRFGEQLHAGLDMINTDCANELRAMLSIN